ncbi:MAG TPA: hypothetical protein VIG49_13685 [Acetobacteraceae bacterium]
MRVSALAGLTMVGLIMTTGAFAADPPAASSSPVIIISGAGSAASATAKDLAQLPITKVTVAFEGPHGSHPASFEGPLLWGVLEHFGAIDNAKPRDQAHRAVLVTGRDGYTATLALGEIAPAFEGKQVILAEREGGHPIDPAHLRIVVPGDKAGGRSVYDLVRIDVVTPGPAVH